MSGKKAIIDISVPVFEGMVQWPGDPKVKIERFMDFDCGDKGIASSMSASLHTGTHLDAPLHFVRGAKAIDQIPLTTFVGEARVVEIHGRPEIDVVDLERADIPQGCERLLFKTDNSKIWDNPAHEFNRDFVAFTPEAARWLVSRKVSLVGIDYLSVQRFRDQTPLTHEILLGGGMMLLEGLDLRAARAGTYELICLPMKLKGAEGAPTRAILREL